MRQSGMRLQRVLSLVMLVLVMVVAESTQQQRGNGASSSAVHFLKGRYSDGAQSQSVETMDAGGSRWRAMSTPRLFGTISLLLLLAPILLLFFAFTTVPVAAGRSLATSFLFPGGGEHPGNSVMEALGQVIETEECVERISCLIFKTTGQYGMFEKIFSLLKMLPKNSSLTKRIVRGTNGKRSGCISFTCSSFKQFWSHVHQQKHPVASASKATPTTTTTPTPAAEHRYRQYRH